MHLYTKRLCHLKKWVVSYLSACTIMRGNRVIKPPSYQKLCCFLFIYVSWGIFSSNKFVSTSASFGLLLKEKEKNSAHFYRPSFSLFLVKKFFLVILYLKCDWFWVTRWWLLCFGNSEGQCIHHWRYFIENMMLSRYFLPSKTLFFTHFLASRVHFTHFLKVFTRFNLGFSENSDYQPSYSIMYTVR